MVGSCRQTNRYQGWSLIHVRRRSVAVWQRMLDEALAEHPCALPGGVGEALPAVLLGEVAGAGREVPVQQEQRGEALLAVEGPKRPVVDLAVDEVEADGRWFVAGDGAAEDVEEVGADPPNRVALAALRVVALEERDLDALDGDAIVGWSSLVRAKNDVRRLSAVMRQPPRAGGTGPTASWMACEVGLAVGAAPEVELLAAGLRVVLQEDVAGADRDVGALACPARMISRRLTSNTELLSAVLSPVVEQSEVRDRVDVAVGWLVAGREHGDQLLLQRR